MVVTLYLEALESSLIERSVAHSKQARLVLLSRFQA